MAGTLDELAARSRQDFAVSLVGLLRSDPASLGGMGPGQFDRDQARCRWEAIAELKNGDEVRALLVGARPEEGASPDDASRPPDSPPCELENAAVASLLLHQLIEAFHEPLDPAEAANSAEWILFINEYCGRHVRYGAAGRLLRGAARYMSGDGDAKIDFLEAARLSEELGLPRLLRVAARCGQARCESDDGESRWPEALATLDQADETNAADAGLADYVDALRAGLSQRHELLSSAMLPEAGQADPVDLWANAEPDIVTPLWKAAIAVAARGRAGEAVTFCRRLDAVARRRGLIADRCRQLGIVALRNSAWAASEALLRAALEDGGDDDPEISLALGRTLRNQGRDEEAVAIFAATTASFPDCGPAWCELGVCQLGLQHNKEAADALARALEIDPDDDIAAMALAQLRPARAVTFDPDSKSISISEDLLEGDPEEAAVLLTAAIISGMPGDIEEKLALCAADKDPEFVERVRSVIDAGSAADRPERAIRRAERLFEARKFAEARTAYAEAIAEEPANAHAYMALGDCHYMLGEFYLAAAYFEESIAIEPDRSTWRFLGDAYRQIGRPQRARAAYESALALDPNYVIARRQLEAMDAAESG